MIQSASIMNCNFLQMGEEIEQLINGGTEYLHIDIIDGHYAPNFGFPYRVISDIKKKYPEIIIDVHVMAMEPHDVYERAISAGADYVSFHTDSTRFVIRNLSNIRKAGAKAGIVINPSQRIDSVEPYLHLVDMVTLMTVEPGFPGQKFLEGGVERIAKLDHLRRDKKMNFKISVDGGVDIELAKQCQKAGADIVVTTIYTVFNQLDGIENACRRLKNELN